MRKFFDELIDKVMAKGHDRAHAVAICKTSIGGIASSPDSMTADQQTAAAVRAEKMCSEIALGSLKFAELSTRDIDAVEIFAAGVWNGDEYTGRDLDDMVSAFDSTKDRIKPYLKLGHAKNQTLLQGDGLPAAGWIENLRRVGNKLVADFKNVPGKIYDLIKAGAYRRVSSELYLNMLVDGTRYPFILKAVSLLGGDTPAVQTLDDILSLYASGGEVMVYENQTKTYEVEIPKEDQMKTLEEVQKELAAANARIVEMEKNGAKVVELTQQVTDLTAKNGELTKQNEKLQGEVKKFSDAADEAQINATLDKLVTDKKIVPAQKPLLFTLMKNVRGAGSEKKFSVGDKELTMEELILKFAESNAAGLSTDEKTRSSDKGNAASPDDVDKKVKKYMEEHKDVSYTEALKVVAPEGSPNAVKTDEQE